MQLPNREEQIPHLKLGKCSKSVVLPKAAYITNQGVKQCRNQLHRKTDSKNPRENQLRESTSRICEQTPKSAYDQPFKTMIDGSFREIQIYRPILLQFDVFIFEERQSLRVKLKIKGTTSLKSRSGGVTRRNSHDTEN